MGLALIQTHLRGFHNPKYIFASIYDRLNYFRILIMTIGAVSKASYKISKDNKHFPAWVFVKSLYSMVGRVRKHMPKAIYI